MNRKIKLIKKTSKTFLLTALLLTIISTFVLYFYTQNLLREEVEEELYSTEARITNALSNNKTVFSLPPVIEIRKIKNLRHEILKDTLIFDPSQDEMELFRELNTFKRLHDQNYHITVRNLVVESGDILIAIVLSNVGIFVLAFLFLFYFNTARNLKLWNPFFRNLEVMKSFSITSNEKLRLVDSDVLEFSELKDEILVLTDKVRSDYENLKQFTEDVSHEMQTPLAIIQAKIDNIINEDFINKKQFEQISSIQKDIQRLKQLNQKITLLTKIKNNQFKKVENVDITKVILEKIENFKELGINNIHYLPSKNIIVFMDAYLADILVNNLLANAIKHGDKSEIVDIITDNDSLVISNSGRQALLHPEKLFLRFYRESNNLRSTGLGLAIVKKICDINNFCITYHFNAEMHRFKVNFSQEKIQI